MTIIGLKELSQNAGRIAERVQNGEEFIVVKRSKPVLALSAPPRDIPSAASKEELEAWTQQAIDRYRPALKALSKK
jgi:antitoxin (DNA-binding transcriptional repressor) of toxin-antitoxin stability system